MPTPPLAHHIVIRRGRDHCYVIFRRDRRKNLPLFAVDLVRQRSDVVPSRGPIGHPVVACCVVLFSRRSSSCESSSGRARPSIMLRSARPKMFRSDSLTNREIDNLYSELVALPW